MRSVEQMSWPQEQKLPRSRARRCPPMRTATCWAAARAQYRDAKPSRYTRGAPSPSPYAHQSLPRPTAPLTQGSSPRANRRAPRPPSGAVPRGVRARGSERRTSGRPGRGPKRDSIHGPRQLSGRCPGPRLAVDLTSMSSARRWRTAVHLTQRQMRYWMDHFWSETVARPRPQHLHRPRRVQPRRRPRRSRDRRTGARGPTPRPWGADRRDHPHGPVRRGRPTAATAMARMPTATT